MADELRQRRPALEALGRSIQGLRVARNLKQSELGSIANLSQSSISKLESGKSNRFPSWDDVNSILVALAASDDERATVRRFLDIAELDPASFESIQAIGNDAKQLQFQQLESRTTLFRGFYLSVFPGLLQLEDYAFFVFLSLGLGNEASTEAARARVRRGHILSQQGRQFVFVMLEHALYSLSHESEEARAALRSQLDYALRASFNSNIRLHVIPADAGLPPRTSCPFLLLDDRYVSAETVVSEMTSSNPSELANYSSLFAELNRLSASQEDSRNLIEQARSLISQT